MLWCDVFFLPRHAVSVSSLRAALFLVVNYNVQAGAFACSVDGPFVRLLADVPKGLISTSRQQGFVLAECGKVSVWASLLWLSDALQITRMSPRWKWEMLPNFLSSSGEG